MALITFVPTDWNPGAAPGISADQLDRIEAGIDDLNSGLWDGVIEVAGGDETNPGLGFNGLAGTGFVGVSTDDLSVAVDSQIVWRFDSLGSIRSQIADNRFRNAVGSAAAPSFTFEDRVADGMYSPASGQVGLSSAGAQVIRFSHAEGIIYSTSTVPNVWKVDGSHATTSSRGLEMRFADSANNFPDEPAWTFRNSASGANPTTTADWQNPVISGGDQVDAVRFAGDPVPFGFVKASSLLEFKVEIRPINAARPMPAGVPGPRQGGGVGPWGAFDPYDLLAITPIMFEFDEANPKTLRDAENPDDRTLVGIVAEDVENNAPWAANYQLDGLTLTDAKDRALIAGLIELARDFDARLTTLEP